MLLPGSRDGFMRPAGVATSVAPTIKLRGARLACEKAVGGATPTYAWPPTDGVWFSSVSSRCATASGERVYGASSA